MPAALFGITNDGLNLAVNLIVLFLVMIYIALIVWTFFDARRRLADDFLVGVATVVSFAPFVGPLIYSIVRPPEFLADKRERELETRSAELRVRQLEESSCPKCSFPIERTYLRCPSCKARVKDPCEACGKPIDPRWSLCPYCETAVRRAAPPAGKAAPKRRAKAPAGSRPKAPAPAGGERRRKAPSEAARRVAASGEQRKPASSRQSSERQARPAKSRPAAKQRPSSDEGAAPKQQAPADGGDERSRPATT
ncbi:MAG: double zinc ribbon domain-containing protein [Solirubrobacterales bacterium]